MSEEATTTEASMGPPELPGGNCQAATAALEASMGFNGAAGITRRKLEESVSWLGGVVGFNGAAGITRRKLEGCDLPGAGASSASMGPPELPGGNGDADSEEGHRAPLLQWGRRNYPAETTPARIPPPRCARASMGPPELPGGNRGTSRRRCTPFPSFNGAAGITRRKRFGLVDIYNRYSASMGPPELPGGNT